MMIEDLNALMNKTEALHEDLKPYVIKTSFGMALNHPLVQEVPLFDLSRCALINARYQMKLGAIEKAATEKKWHSYIYLHERPYRFGALMDVATKQIEETELAELIGSVWVDSENIWQHQKDWHKLWSQLKSTKATMDEEELKALECLPDELKIFRGIRSRNLNQKGLSWTLDESRAIWFAGRYKGKSPIVISATVRKNDIFAYFTGRGENEVVVDPKKLTILKRTPIMVLQPQEGHSCK